MRFLRSNNVKKVILVISDVHLGAGVHVQGRRNILEDFHFDKEMVEFLEYYSTGIYASKEVELIINGDFFDFLAIPYVPFFDDEFWSEKAALEKLKICVKAHIEVVEALKKFCDQKKKNITYILGNHDAELIFESCQNYLLEKLEQSGKDSFRFKTEEEYNPVKSVAIKHGHLYEFAHTYDPKDCIVKSNDGENYFLPPWGSYYVMRIINKYKQERTYINCVKPIRNFLIWGIVFDPLFTLRFIFSTCQYFIMVRMFGLFKQRKMAIKRFLEDTMYELELFRDFDSIVHDFFNERDEIETLIVGHTHEATLKTYPQGKTFINTGTWTKMYNLDFAKKQDGYKLTYAQIEVKESEGNEDGVCESSLNIWHGVNKLPYSEFH